MRSRDQYIEKEEAKKKRNMVIICVTCVFVALLFDVFADMLISQSPTSCISLYWLFMCLLWALLAISQ